MKTQLQAILGAQGYTAGIRYGGTYGVNPLACLQGIKDLLIDNGMQVFESTEMERLDDHTAYTHAGSVTADNIIIAVDKLSDSISPLADEAFHAQTFLSVTEPLTDRELRILFPVGRADAVLGLEARVFVLQTDRRTTACCSVAARPSPLSSRMPTTIPASSGGSSRTSAATSRS